MELEGCVCPGIAYLLDDAVIASMDSFEPDYERRTLRVQYGGEYFDGVAYFQNRKSS